VKEYEYNNNKNNEISGVCSTSGRNDKCIQNLNLKFSRSEVHKIVLKEREREDVSWVNLG
jgi:hypothetical protein